jgi:hypothetical protein
MVKVVFQTVIKCACYLSCMYFIGLMGLVSNLTISFKYYHMSPINSNFVEKAEF